MKDVVADALRAGLLIGKGALFVEEARTEADTVTGWPVVVGCADAPGASMTREELLGLEQDGQRAEDVRRAGLPT